MKKVEIQPQNHLEIEGIEGFFIRKVTKFETIAKSSVYYYHKYH